MEFFLELLIVMDRDPSGIRYRILVHGISQKKFNFEKSSNISGISYFSGFIFPFRHITKSLMLL